MGTDPLDAITGGASVRCDWQRPPKKLICAGCDEPITKPNKWKYCSTPCCRLAASLTARKRMAEALRIYRWLEMEAPASLQRLRAASSAKETVT